ncbi:hypothetical protein O9992_13305 [Vibrio lentus]|nr:hypothetical protein [Vibrio lentus]
MFIYDRWGQRQQGYSIDSKEQFLNEARYVLPTKDEIHDFITGHLIKTALKHQIEVL